MTCLRPVLLLLLCTSMQAQNLDDVLKELLTTVRKINTDLTTLATRVDAIELKVNSGGEDKNNTQLTEIESHVKDIIKRVANVDAAQVSSGQQVSEVLGKVTQIDAIKTQLMNVDKNQSSTSATQLQELGKLSLELSSLAKRVSDIQVSSTKQINELQGHVIEAKTNAAESKNLASQCSTKNDVMLVGNGVGSLQVSAKQSALQLLKNEQSCTAKSLERGTQLNQVLVELGKIQDTHKTALLTTAPCPTPTRPADTPAVPRSMYPVDCADAASRGLSPNGIYFIQATGGPTVKAVCSDGWTLVQRRIGGDVAFDRFYTEYETGFGLPELDHWIGLKTLHFMTKSHSCNLRAEFYLDDKASDNLFHYQKYSKDGNGKKKFVEILHFAVGDKASGYKLSLSGVTSDLQHPNALMFEKRQDNIMFSAKDMGSDQQCAQAAHSGWWFGGCGNLHTDYNGNYGFGNRMCGAGNRICALNNPYWLRSVEMKLKC